MSITARIMRWLLVISGFKFWLGLAFKYPPQWLVNAWPAMLPKGLATQWREVKGRRIATLSPNWIRSFTYNWRKRPETL